MGKPSYTVFRRWSEYLFTLDATFKTFYKDDPGTEKIISGLTGHQIRQAIRQPKNWKWILNQFIPGISKFTTPEKNP